MPDITIIVISGKTVSQSLLTQITDRNIGTLYYHIHYPYYLHIIIVMSMLNYNYHYYYQNPENLYFCLFTKYM